MLRLKNIVKKYNVAGQDVDALKGINLSFRENEFVSILGPSGCGKTTTLNIIGGLDQYTSGDLFIAGKSTKEFNDKAWDVYRNHRVGFIFQSYNLIPHQTILGNVELALTIAGISKEERVKRAKEAIDRVGLKGQYNKKPNQLSGGQCQRVAIARALVNEPEILLADEPTGALDTVTSVQIMELIKEISKEKLVIMVTHNPELAQKYSSRIVNLLDGQVISDSNPFSEEEEIKECEERTNLIDKAQVEIVEKAKMSFFTAFKLSFKNLLSKSKRTIMTVVAGSIGIVGVATVLAVSRGVKDYIANMQDDMLSGNPIQITKSGIDYNLLMDQSSLSDKREALEKGDWVNINSMIQYLTGNQDVLMSLMYNNEFTDEYVNYVKSMPKDYYSAISLNYGIDVTMNIYTDFKVSNNPSYSDYQKTMSLDAITEYYTALIGELDDYAQYASIITSLTNVFEQGISNNDYILKQYDIVEGKLPTDKEDVLIVLDDESELTDLLLAQLGYYTQEEFFNLVYSGLNQPENMTSDTVKTRFEYDELLGKEFTWYPNETIYTENENNKLNPFLYSYEAQDSWTSTTASDSKDKEGIKLNICGIVKPKSGVNYGALSQGFLYTEDLAREMIRRNSNSPIVNYVKKTEEKAIYSGVYNSLKTGVYYDLEYFYDRKDGNDKYHTKTVFVGQTNEMTKMLSLLGDSSTSGLSTMLTIDTRMLGGESLPSTISIYPVDFDLKDKVTDYLDEWNSDNDVTFNVYNSDFTEVIETKTIKAGVDERKTDIKYTDTVGLIINMINMMINIITTALVAFTALSLVVSTVMVGIITYVSVVERTKEIGVIRSLGGRKKDVSHLFNAETFMIGLSSGIFGILVTGIICILLNVIVKALADISSIAHLTLTTSIVMIIISILLTLISGFFPARSAAKRDPVEALRSE